jgi:uncharacterized DUF497 family protein
VKFEWDLQKAARNVEKHGVTFQEASTVFRDPLSATAQDPDHSFSELRYVSIGLSMPGRLLTVAHSERRDCIRLISARVATKQERRIYEEEES